MSNIIISEIIKLSLKFDEDLKNNKFDDLKNISDKIISYFKNINKSDIKSNKKLIDLCEKIIKINECAIKYVKNDSNKMTKNDSDKMTKNILVLIYDKNSDTNNFLSEWMKLLEKYKNKINFISMDYEKNKELCNGLNLKNCPAIKYITSTKIHDYDKDLNFYEIEKTFMLK
jgi:hypothetical protein